ncbi:MAG: phenylalanine--tRNA ligase subunit alpha [gamma proteobacterium endosymbiont of Trioza apicalis]
MLNFTKFIIKTKIDINKSKNIKELNSIRINFFNKKNIFNMQIKNIKNLPKKDRPKIGMIINKKKKEIEYEIKKHKKFLINKNFENKIKKESIDITLPGRYIENGSLNPISNTIKKIENFFSKLGFISINGPEIEDNYHNFDALNIPNSHPSRNKNDTFWFNDNLLLRTHTSSVQIRILKKNKPPIRIIAPGKVYRNDYDKTHTPMFHQIEGLIIEKNLNFLYLKTILQKFLVYFFSKKIKIRFRPSYFPFTKPSAEIDIKNKKNHWLEVLGCGVIHPKILNNFLIDKNIYTGLAFGIGIERITMLKYNINDIRKFFENDIRFLKQFK